MHWHGGCLHHKVSSLQLSRRVEPASAVSEHTCSWRRYHTCACLSLTEEQMLKQGYPAYTTSCAWLGYSDEKLREVPFKTSHHRLQGY